MDSFREKAFYLLIWRSFLAGLIAIVLMATRSFALGAALLIGAIVALLFSLILIVWAGRLDDERVVHTEAWRLLRPNQRPQGAAGTRWAGNYLRDIHLCFAKAASAVAIALLASALVLASE